VFCLFQVTALRSLKQQELVDFYITFFRAGAPHRRKLSVQVFGGSHIKALDKLGASENGFALANGLGSLTLNSERSQEQNAAPASSEVGSVSNGLPSAEAADGVSNGSIEKVVEGGNGGGGANMVRIEDIAAFKRARPLFESVTGRSARLSAL
jgi:hypothetical protein